MNLKDKVKEYAKLIHIDLIGFTSAKPFEDLRSLFIEREKAGYLAGFQERDLELRIDPKKTLKSAQSIIAIGLSYYFHENGKEAKDEQAYDGDMARIARGKDYHHVVKSKLEKIAAFLKKEKEGLEYISFVDTGPLVDRHVAYRSGLGYYGYNTSLINQEFGSWIFIGYLLTNICFEEDNPLKELSCQECRMCIEHCPTGALEKPYYFNAKKCISNVLQQKEFIPEEIRPLLGKRIYGCDVCQEICPHNHAPKKAEQNHFKINNNDSKVSLEELLNITNKKYFETYGQTAAGWRGKRILQRNAIIALANYNDKKAIVHLLPLLKDARPEIKEYALWAIKKLNSIENH
jgi:epoxyqueuosine reductase